MPRPQKLGSPRAEQQNESDHEIIKIVSDDEEEMTKLRVEVHGVADLHFRGSFLPSSWSMIPGRSNGNQQSQILNRSFRTVQTDVNPTEVSMSRQLAGRKPNKRLPDENIDHPRTSIKQIKQRVLEETKTSADIKIEDNAPNTSDFTSQELDSFLEVESNKSTIIVESDEAIIEVQELSANPSLVENPEQTIFDSENLRKSPLLILTDCANLSENSKATTPLAKNINFGTNKPKDGENPSKIRENLPPAIASSSKIVEAGHSSKATTNLAKSTNFVTEKPKDGEIPSKIRENLPPAIASSSKIVEAGHSSKATTKLAKSTNFVTEKPKYGENPSKIRENVPPAIASSSKIVETGHSSKATTKLAKSTNFVTEKPKDGEIPSKIRENLPPAIASSSKIVEAGHSSKATTNLAKSTNFVTEKPKDGENPSKIRENVPPAIAWKIRCIVCKKTFAVRKELRRHATLEHPNTRFFNCDLCGDSFLTRDELKLHFADDDNHDVDKTTGAKLTKAHRTTAFARSNRWVINRKIHGRNLPKPEHDGHLKEPSKPTGKIMESKKKSILQRRNETKTAVQKEQEIAREDPDSEDPLCFRMKQKPIYNESDDNSNGSAATLNASEINKIIEFEVVNSGPEKKPVIQESTSSVTSYHLCENCQELESLMKQVSRLFNDSEEKEMSVKCPFCSFSFVTLFWVKEHISCSHLSCQKENCKLATSLKC